MLMIQWIYQTLKLPTQWQFGMFISKGDFYFTTWVPVQRRYTICARNLKGMYSSKSEIW